MRPIKFRYVLKHKKTGEIEFEIFTLLDIERGLEDVIKAYTLIDYEIISRDQYIGVNDKSGKEIYGEDIVKCGNMIGKIVFEMNSWMILIQKPIPEMEQGLAPLGIHTDKHTEVLGNIHKNPELLEAT